MRGVVCPLLCVLAIGCGRASVSTTSRLEEPAADTANKKKGPDDRKGPDDEKAPVDKAVEALDGTYGLFMASRDGKRDSVLNDVNTVVIKSGVLTFLRPTGTSEVLKFTLDPTKSPGHIDFGKFPGVYEIGTLGGKPVINIAYRIDGGARPKSVREEGPGVRAIAIAR